MPSAMPPSRLHALVTGRVQGVGFRQFVWQQAVHLGLTGFVRNLSGGGVEVVAEGPPALLRELQAHLGQGPPGARVTNLQVSCGPATGDHHSFTCRPVAR